MNCRDLDSVHGVSVLDGPVSGSTPAAEVGLLTLLGGEEFFSSAKAIFNAIGWQDFYLGPSGFGRLDIPVNNAGTEGLRGLVIEQTAESYAATFVSNVLGVLLSTKHELRALLPQGSGSIVNISSAYGSVGVAGASVYVASKHAVEGLTKAAPLEVAGTDVRVNCVTSLAAGRI